MVPIDEPNLEDTIEILRGIRTQYEDHHRVMYTPQALQAAARLAQRYVTGRFMPDKAIDLLDEAGAKRKLESDTRPSELGEIEAEIRRLTSQKVALVSAQDYEAAAELRDRVRALRAHLESIREAWQRAAREERPVGGRIGYPAGGRRVHRYSPFPAGGKRIPETFENRGRTAPGGGRAG